MFSYKKFALTLSVLSCAAIALGSDPVPHWDHQWRLAVYNLYCDLGKEYIVPGFSKYHEPLWTNPNQGASYSPPHKGPLEDTVYFRVLAGFKINTRTHDTVYPAELVGKNRFYFFLYPEEHFVPNQYLDSEDKRAELVTVNGEEADRENEYAYYLSVEKTNTVFELHKRDQPIQINILLNDGESRQLDIHPFRPKQFPVWAAMLETCARENAE